MTESGFTAMFLRLDQVWGTLDEGLEDGYRYALDEFPDELVSQALLEFARGEHRRPEDLRWMPRPPEIARRASQLLADRSNQRRIRGLVERLALPRGRR